MANQQESALSYKAKVAAVVLFYMGSALVMVFVNKAVLNSAPTLPFSFLFIQLFIAVILLHIAAFIWASPLGKSLPGTIELPSLDIQVAKNLLPVVLIGVVGLVFNTLCLALVDASFFQIARGLALPITIVVSAIYTRNAPGASVILSATVVTVGFFIGVSPASYFSSAREAPQTTALSVIFGCLSSLTLAVHAVLVKSAYKYVDNSVIKFTYWGNLLSALALIPGIVLNGEVGPGLAMLAGTVGDRRLFIIGCAVTGLFGFFLSMASLLSIKVTSPITHMFSSATRSVIQTMLGIWLFGDIVTSNRALSILIITVGAIYYTWIKSGPPPTPPVSTDKDDVESQKLMPMTKSES